MRRSVELLLKPHEFRHTTHDGKLGGVDQTGPITRYSDKAALKIDRIPEEDTGVEVRGDDDVHGCRHTVTEA